MLWCIACQHAFKTRPKLKVNVQLRWISLFSKTTTSSLPYELGVNGEKKLMETGILGIAQFTLVNSKPGTFNSLIEVISNIL